MSKEEQIRIAHFIKDKATSEAVYYVLLENFLKTEPWMLSDVNMMAAARTAITLLQNGWQELERCKYNEEEKQPQVKQVGM